jgi:hypothetical protein
MPFWTAVRARKASGTRIDLVFPADAMRQRTARLGQLTAPYSSALELPPFFFKFHSCLDIFETRRAVLLQEFNRI